MSDYHVTFRAEGSVIRARRTMPDGSVATHKASGMPVRDIIYEKIGTHPSMKWLRPEERESWEQAVKDAGW